MKIKKSVSAFILTALLLSLAAPPALAEGETVHIRTAEDLQKLSADCTLDTYSKGLTVVLDNDIDLDGAEFYPIPSFSGSFEGGGHRIYNMVTAPDGSHQGLFRYIQAEGRVSGLNVEGTVSPGGSRSQVGGIAGINYGEISECSFKGTAVGLNYVGGIAGENHGSITACTSEGKVDGKRFTGGVAGYNCGTINACTNLSQVNTSISEGGLELDRLNLSDITKLDLTGAEDTDVVSDSGGIAGFSSGLIQSSTNCGTVGYRHYGYNAGGIAGRQSGYISACTNQGEVCGRKDIGGIVGQMEPFMLLKSSASLSGELYTLHSLVVNALGNIDGMSDALRSTLNSIKDSSSSAVDKISGGSADDTDSPITKLPGETPEGDIPAISLAAEGPGGENGGEASALPGISLPDGVRDDLNSMANEMGALADIMGQSGGALARDLVKVSDQLSRVIMLLANSLSGMDKTVFEDISAAVSKNDTDGRVCLCLNEGNVSGDINVGGIAGTMGIEYEFDMEGTLSKTLGMGNILTATYQTKCVCTENINRGCVTAKKDNVGGIAGLSELGLISSCQGYGSVSSQEGGYAGGVAGYSNSSVQSCWAMCSIEGAEYVGGIAGYGTKINGCASLVGLEKNTACSGAIAGWADVNAENNITDNIYVHQSLGAVDGISYSGKAYGVSFEELLNVSGLPAQFKKLRLSFVADGKLIKELEFDYGGSIDESLLPSVPEKAGYSGAWSDHDYSVLCFSDTIEAVYTPRQAAIAAGDTRGESPMSIVLLEGDFESGAGVSLNEYSGEGPQLNEGKVLEKWVLRLDSPGKAGENYTVRYLSPDTEQKQSRIDIYTYTDGSWNLANAGQSGSYLTFPGSGDTVVFCAVETEADNSALKAIIIISVCAATALISFIVIKRRKNTKAAVSKENE